MLTLCRSLWAVLARYLLSPLSLVALYLLRHLWTLVRWVTIHAWTGLTAFLEQELRDEPHPEEVAMAAMRSSSASPPALAATAAPSSAAAYASAVALSESSITNQLLAEVDAASQRAAAIAATEDVAVARVDGLDPALFDGSAFLLPAAPFPSQHVRPLAFGTGGSRARCCCCIGSFLAASFRLILLAPVPLTDRGAPSQGWVIVRHACSGAISSAEHQCRTASRAQR